jgi:hypothetical protein
MTDVLKLELKKMLNGIILILGNVRLMFYITIKREM